MASKGTGFHPSDPDWTQGRAIAITDAESIARRNVSMARGARLVPILAARKDAQ